MDFTNLEETAREAKLDYGESESLLRFLNFQRERRGEPPIYADYGQLCDHLSEIYPDVEFNLADHRIVARVKSGVSGSLIDQIGFISSHIPHYHLLAKNRERIALRALDSNIWGSGRNFDFCYGSGVETQPLTKIKGDTATDISLVGAQRHRSDAYKPL
jgi:hypothetical protein